MRLIGSHSPSGWENEGKDREGGFNFIYCIPYVTLPDIICKYAKTKCVILAYVFGKEVI